jgi:hypothetical protein
MRTAHRARILLVVGTAQLVGCSDLFHDITDPALTRVSGSVVDNRGEPVADARVKIFGLLEHTDFVEGGDAMSGQAYIDKAAIIASDGERDSANTDDDGNFEIKNIAPGAFLALAEKDGCTAGFAGFDPETGILSTDTLITPSFAHGIDFDVPEFTIACATPPEVGPDGNSDDAPPYVPPDPVITCDATTCSAAGGSCDGDACTITCSAESCAASGGTCEGGACVLPVCSASTCEADGGACSADDTTCALPACSSDADCAAGQPGSYCTDPGDVMLAACQPPVPGEIVPPAAPLGFTSLRVLDANNTVIADASGDNQIVAPDMLPADGIVRIAGDYDGTATLAYLQVQSGGQACPNLPPHTDAIPVEIVDGQLASSQGPFVELALTGGQQKIQLGTSEALGDGERSWVVELGEPCAPPAKPFTAILSWEAGPGQPADLDISVWNAAGELVFVGNKQAAWGKLALEGKGPGPEVFEADDMTQGPFTIKVEFFSGKPRDLEAKLRILRTVAGQATDESFTFVVSHPKDIAEIGVFTAE